MVSFSQDHSMPLTCRSRSFANNPIINRLKRRVSFASGQNSRPSFHMRSHANLSIYRVSEASNESPDKMSSGKPSKNNATGVLSRGRVSASFYFHANKLSAWQSNLSN